MEAVLEIHLVVGFLVVLCALIFSWTPTGRRVVNTVVAVQILIGLVLAGLLGAALRGVGLTLVTHIAMALLAAAAYGMAAALARKRGAVAAYGASAVGLIAVIVAMALGWHMAGRI